MPPDLSQAHVLVADDAPTVRQSIRLTLAQAGITRVDTANSIGETRRRVRNGNYDVVLCDYHFGEGMNGQELLEELRRSGELPLSTIWFMITAEASYEKVVAVAEVGPDDYLINLYQCIASQPTVCCLDTQSVFAPDTGQNQQWRYRRCHCSRAGIPAPGRTIPPT